MSLEKVNIYEIHNEYFLWAYYLQKCNPYRYRKISAKELTDFSLLVFSSLHIKFLRHPEMYEEDIDIIASLSLHILDIKNFATAKMHLIKIAFLLDSVIKGKEIDTPINNLNFHESEIKFIKAYGVQLSEMNIKEINKYINAGFKQSLEAN